MSSLPLLPQPTGCGDAPLLRCAPGPCCAWPRLASRVLVNPGFLLGYSEWRGGPLWVAYALNPEPAHDLPPRPRGFRGDDRVWNGLRPGGLKGSGYDRGHLAPNYAIARHHGREAQRATFRLSNIVPQRPALNQLIWQRLEEAESDRVAPRLARLWVIAGPIHDPRAGRGAPPVAFFRIWWATDGRRWRALAFRVPQSVCGGELPSAFLTTVDALERETGLDFAPALDAAEAEGIEARVDAEAWPLAAVDDLPLRYAGRFDLSACKDTGFQPAS